MVGPGFQFASSMETLRIGMAGILASTTKMGEEQTTYAQGLEISEKILKRMQVEALRTTMTVQELSEAYQSTLAGGLNAGMDLEQIMDLTLAAANAVLAAKNAADILKLQKKDEQIEICSLVVYIKKTNL